MERGQIATAVQEVCVEVKSGCAKQIGSGGIDRELSLPNDLGMDSIDLRSLLLELEDAFKQFELDLPDSILETVCTTRALIDYISNALKATV